MILTDRRIVAGLLLTFLAPQAVFGDSYPVDEFIDIEHYRFMLELSDKTDEISGTVTVQAKLLKQGIRKIRLNLINRTEQSGGYGMVVHSVVQNGDTLSFEHVGNSVLIELASPSVADDVVTIDIEYSGIPETGLLIKDNKHGERTFFSDNWSDKPATGYRPSITFRTRQRVNSW